MRNLANIYQDEIVAKALSSCKYIGYSHYAIRFYELASEAENEELRLLYYELGEICSAQLELKTPQKPYRFIHKTFVGVDSVRVSLYQALLPRVSDSLLLARLADFVWVFGGKDVAKRQYAESSINGYLSLPFFGKDWYSGVDDCYLRALQIARSLGKAGERYLAAIAGRIERVIEAENVHHLRELSDILEFTLRAEMTPCNYGTLIDKVFKAIECYSAVDYIVPCHAYDLLIAYQTNVLNQPLLIAQTKVKKSRLLMATGKSVLDANGDKRLAGARYEEAERELSSIPKSLRTQYDVEKLMLECRDKSRAGYVDWNEHLHLFKSPPVNLRSRIETSIDHVKGLPLERVFPRFAVMYEADVCAIRQATLDSLSNTALWMIASRTILTDDGRAEITIPPYDPREPDSAESRLRVDAEIISFMYPNEIKFAVRGCLYPAYTTIKSDYDVPGQFFFDMCRQASFIPSDRCLSCTRALIIGWQGDFDSAAKLLVPQIENIIRTKLRSIKAETRHRDVKNATETENGLSQLVVVHEKELAGLLGKDCACELKWLFGPAPYLNLRNIYAHGLMGDVKQDELNIIAFYLWWFFLGRVVRACCQRDSIS